MIIELIKPLTLLLSLSLLLAFVYHLFARESVKGKILAGLLYGFIAVTAMMMPYNFIPGFIFDGRSVIISLSGFFGGPLVAIPAVVIAASYRLWLGGTGALAGALVVLYCGVVGVVYYYIRIK